MTAAACLLTISSYAAQINTIIDTGSGMWSDPEKVYTEVDESVKVGLAYQTKVWKS